MFNFFPSLRGLTLFRRCEPKAWRSSYWIAASGLTSLLAMTAHVEAASLPIEIQAQGQIVCDQKENFCLAEEDAIAIRGDLKIQGDRLKIVFEPSPSSNTSDPQKRQPEHLEAKGNVHITLPGREAYGKEAFYFVKDGVFILRGAPQIKTPDVSLTSQKPMRYCEKNGLGSTQDGLVVHSPKQCAMRAPVMHAFWRRKEEGGAQVIEKIIGEGGVWLVSPRHTLYADNARYDVPHNRIVLKGGVKVADPHNLLEGNYAIVSLGPSEKVELFASDPDLYPSHPPSSSKRRIKALLIPKELRSSLPSSPVSPSMAKRTS